MFFFRSIGAVLLIGMTVTAASGQSWVYNQFSNFGGNWSANNHSIPQGAAGYGGTVAQPQPYMQSSPAPQPLPYNYNVPSSGYQQQRPIPLNPQLTNPNNFSYMRPASPPPPAPRYAPNSIAAPVYIPPSGNTFRRR